MMILMNFMFLLLTAAVREVHSEEDQSGGEDQPQVVIKDSSVALTCPIKASVDVTWYQEKNELKNKNNTLEIKNSDGTVAGFYSCKKNEKKYYFFIKTRVCKNCHELSGSMAGGVILADLLFTGGVILIIYFCTQRKKDQVSNAPRPPNPDYEALNPKTQSRDLYAGLK